MLQAFLVSAQLISRPLIVDVLGLLHNWPVCVPQKVWAQKPCQRYEYWPIMQA